MLDKNRLFGKARKATKRAAFWLCVALCLCFVGGVFAQMINTNFYQTDVISFTIPTDDGQWVTGSVFKPKTATSSDPAPAVVFVPGFQRTKESHYDIALEIARRGMVCFIIDPYNQGDSSASLNTSSSSAEGGAYGAIPLINYLYDTDNINYIDKDNIAIVGHSAGGNSALTAAVYFSNLAGGVYENCKVKAVYVSGYIRNIISVDVETDEDGNTLFEDPETGELSTDKYSGYVKLGDEGVDWEGSKVANLSINLGFGYCLKDEGAWQNVNLTGDITRVDSYESLALMTSGGNHTYLRETGIEAGKIYGQASDGTLRVGYQENTLHGMQPFDVRSTAHILYFLDYTFEMNSTISCNNQIWMWKQAFQLVMLVGVFMAIFPITKILLDMPFFKGVKREEKPREVPKGKKTWIPYVVTMLIGATCACFTFVPLADLSKTLFSDAAAHRVTWTFPERMNNAVMLWAAVNGTIGFILYFANWLLFGRKKGEKLRDMGFNIGVKNFFKTLLLAFTVWAAFYGLVHGLTYLFGVDPRFLFVAVRTTNVRYLLYGLEYIPFFFIFYLSNSVRVNNSAVTNNNGGAGYKVLSYVLAVLSNTLGLFGIFAIQYISLGVTGTMFWTTDWLYTNMLWILIPMMFLLPIFQKLIYKKSNNIYLGAIITCLIFVTISMCNSVAHGPFYF